MKNRDQKLIAIREKIPNAKINCISEFEKFQNLTLRPILKLQNDLTLLILKNNKAFNSLSINSKNKQDLNLELKFFLTKNLQLKVVIINSIVALFTQEEYLFYIENKKELNKRILSMQIKRYLDEVF